MIGDRARTIASVQLTRPRSARPFKVDDVQRLDPLRPWLAHAFRQTPRPNALEHRDLAGVAGSPVLSGKMILRDDAKVIFQTRGVKHLLGYVDGRKMESWHHNPDRDGLPAPVLRLLQQITGGADGTSAAPPHMQLSTPYGILTLEAQWLMPANTPPADVAKDPKSCLIAVTIELREHALARAARVCGRAAPRRRK